MKSPALLHSTETLDFHLLQKTSNLQITKGNKIKRRTSRKNLMIFTMLYGASLALALYMLAA